MNMAEANGALLAAGDVSILFLCWNSLSTPDQANILPDSKCSQAEWRKCTFNIYIGTVTVHSTVHLSVSSTIKEMWTGKQWTSISKRLCPVFQTVGFIKNEVNSCLNFSHRKQYHCLKCCLSWGPYQTISLHQNELSSAFIANSNFWCDPTVLIALCEIKWYTRNVCSSGIKLCAALVHWKRKREFLLKHKCTNSVLNLPVLFPFHPLCCPVIRNKCTKNTRHPLWLEHANLIQFPGGQWSGFKKNPQQSNITQLQNAGMDVIVNIMVFVHSTWTVVAAVAFIKWQFHRMLWKRFNFPLHLRWVGASTASTGCWGPLQPGPCRHKLLGEHSAPSCDGPLWQSGKGGDGLRGSGGGGGFMGGKKIERPSLICILSKGTTVSSVRAQMVLCWGKRERSRGSSIKHRFFSPSSGVSKVYVAAIWAKVRLKWVPIWVVRAHSISTGMQY